MEITIKAGMWDGPHILNPFQKQYIDLLNEASVKEVSANFLEWEKEQDPTGWQEELDATQLLIFDSVSPDNLAAIYTVATEKVILISEKTMDANIPQPDDDLEIPELTEEFFEHAVPNKFKDRKGNDRDMRDVIAIVRKILSDESGGRIKPEGIKLNAHLTNDLELDSMEMGKVITAISTEFGVTGRAWYETFWQILEVIAKGC